MLKILHAGFFTTLQDLGRYGHRDKGVPISGPMDEIAFGNANGLLQNHPNAAVLEFTMIGPTVQFGEPTYFTITGAHMQPVLNQTPLKGHKVYKAQKDDVLTFKGLVQGYRGYLAVKGGFGTPGALGSQSLYGTVTQIARFHENDEIPYGACPNLSPSHFNVMQESHLEESTLLVSKGPEYNHLHDRQLEHLFAKDFTVSKDNDRMAYQLGETIPGHTISMLTSATLPGTVQLTPSGRIIILMKDGQTTGGYPRILQLTQRALSILSQKKMGDSVNFKLV
ncbi:MAG: biotin-dependent carboxyltransferase family protein [Flavobacteriaceae bacterium]